MNKLSTLGDYSLVKQIGQGALGSVFLAEHRFMKKTFALKILPEDLCKDRAFIQQFEEDVALLSSLKHPNIVSIHNISYDQGVYFLVCDCIVDEIGENSHLGHYLQENPNGLPEEEVYHFVQQIGGALHYIHTAYSGDDQVIHRAIKPSNLLVSASASGRRLILSDCGLSKILGTGPFLSRTIKSIAEGLELQTEYGKPGDEKVKLSSANHSFLQSFQYLSPEQKEYDSIHPVTVQSDYFSLGMVIYKMLTGILPQGFVQLPSEVRNDLKYRWDDLIRRLLQQSPIRRPSALLPLLEKIKTPVEQIDQIAGTYQVSHNESAQIAGGLKPFLHSTQLERPTHDPDPAAVFSSEMTVQQYNPEIKREYTSVEPLQTDMVVIEGGVFVRGSRDGNRDEMPAHQITLENFAIDIHPVTNEQFVRFLAAMQGIKDRNHNDMIRLRDSRIKSTSGKFSIESGYIKHPVVGVTWYGAVAYAKWVGKRLPTEAEWEVASRGGLEETIYPTGETIEKSQANFFSSDTTAVMSYAPNEYNLFDMAGNVYEWCQDWYGFNYYEASVQEPFCPKGPPQGVYRVLRGGCWKSLVQDLRCSNRHRNNPRTVNSTYGFRCAADVK